MVFTNHLFSSQFNQPSSTSYSQHEFTQHSFSVTESFCLLVWLKTYTYIHDNKVALDFKELIYKCFTGGRCFLQPPLHYPHASRRNVVQYSSGGYAYAVFGDKFASHNFLPNENIPSLRQDQHNSNVSTSVKIHILT